MPGGGGGHGQVTIPFFRRELAVRAFWSNAILCRLALFKGLCSGGGESDNVQFVNSRLRSRQEMSLLQRTESNTTFSNLNMFICISLIECVHCPLSICGFSGMLFCGAFANFL